MECRYSEFQPVGEPTSADSDALKHAVAGQLVHDKGRIEQSGRLVVVWHNAPNEVGIGLVEGGQKLVKLRSERRGDSFEDLRPCILSLLLLLSDFFRLSCTVL